jgi:murein DD-endopeptidase MepM/ murein hydrolase activator NlpD
MDEKKLHSDFENWAKDKQFSLKELFPSIAKTDIFHIDLSIKNTTVKRVEEFNNLTYFENKIEEIQLANPTKIIAGGYLEKRALYTSDIYNAKDSSEKRNIHLGIDFWLPKKTAIHAIFDGEVVCAVHQKSHKGYGGFIILKHLFNQKAFYTLYGHLSEKSVLQFSLGDIIKSGEQIGVLGNTTENGDWVPHLHFQIMLSLLDFKDDFPGVALESEITFWKLICPNPNLLFKSSVL